MTDDDTTPRPSRKRVPGLEDYGVIGRDELQRQIEREVERHILQRGLLTRDQTEQLLREQRVSVREEIMRRWANISISVSPDVNAPGPDEEKFRSLIIAWKAATVTPGRAEKIWAFVVQMFEEDEASKGRVMRTVLVIAGILSALATVTGALFTVLQGHHS